MAEREEERRTEAFGDNARRVLRSAVERIERIEEEIKGLNDDKKDIYKEAKSAGFDHAIIRKVIAVRKNGRDEHDEQVALVDVYLRALDAPASPSKTTDDEGNACPGVAV